MDQLPLIILAVIGAPLWLLSFRLKKSKRIGVATAGEFLQVAGATLALTGLGLLGLQEILSLF